MWDACDSWPRVAEGIVQHRSGINLDTFFLLNLCASRVQNGLARSLRHSREEECVCTADPHKSKSVLRPFVRTIEAWPLRKDDIARSIEAWSLRKDDTPRMWLKHDAQIEKCTKVSAKGFDFSG